MDTAAAESPAISEWLQIRKDAAARIDPTTAEVTFNGGRPIDPYGVLKLHLPPEYYCIGRNYFACDPKEEIWVSFYHLPKNVVAILERRIAKGEFDDQLPW